MRISIRRRHFFHLQYNVAYLLQARKPSPFALSLLSVSTSGIIKESRAEAEALAREISGILSGAKNWRTLVMASDIPSRLTPEVLSTVLRQRPREFDVRLLLDFFNWACSRLGLPPKPDSFALLAIHLCNSGHFGPANGLLERMISTYPSHLSVLDSLKDAFLCIEGSNLKRCRPLLSFFLISM
ncbi:hypothetical protein HPP92_025492 [Vanilla planifolia]|uniref:Pentatricopeptide repeat-containing protein n=1 Tax=Vanilla planifolia TaxID=51239 RepID=A0A835U922_VANPL|nr:hypothetical protein HPP92_025492 [Vanilla planifolia]